MSELPSPTPRLVRWIRLTRLAIHMARGAGTIALIFPLVGRPRQQKLISRWASHLLHILRVRVRTHGVVNIEPRTLIVSNHVSWLDIWLLQSITAVCFVAKSEIRSWPLIGWMAAQARTLFIERGRKRDTSRINEVIHRALHAQEAVAIFPEGMTSDGTHVRRFHASLLQPAVELQAPVLIVGIRYRRGDGGINTQVAYADETTLWQSLQAILAHGELEVDLIELGHIVPEGKSRRDIAQEAEKRVRGALFPTDPDAPAPGLPTELP